MSHGPNWTRNKNAQEEGIKDKITKKKKIEEIAPISKNRDRGREMNDRDKKIQNMALSDYNRQLFI